MMKKLISITLVSLTAVLVMYGVHKSAFSQTPKRTFSDFVASKSAFIEEDGSPSGSNSKNWWVNSGGSLTVVNGVGRTPHGEQSPDNKWFKEFSGKADADYGKHPQNLFRLVTRSEWTNFTQEAYFKMDKYNLSESPNRTGSNGFFLFNRYALDGQTLYYTGLRVDGTASIKKKYKGTYYTMSSVKVLSGTYNRDSNPTLLSTNVWYGLRSVINTKDGVVTISFYTDIGKTGKWKLASQVTDDGVKYKNPIITSGYAGIRTDFMDAQFKNYKLTSL